MAKQDNPATDSYGVSNGQEDNITSTSSPSPPPMRARRRTREREEVVRTNLLRRELNGSELWEGTYKGPLSTRVLPIYIALSSWNIFNEKNQLYPQLPGLQEERAEKLMRLLGELDHQGLVQYLKVMEDEDYIDILIQQPQVSI